MITDLSARKANYIIKYLVRKRDDIANQVGVFESGVYKAIDSHWLS
jgi:hypothetical protein